MLTNQTRTPAWFYTFIHAKKGQKDLKFSEKSPAYQADPDGFRNAIKTTRNRFLLALMLSSFYLYTVTYNFSENAFPSASTAASIPSGLSPMPWTTFPFPPALPPIRAETTLANSEASIPLAMASSLT